MKKFIAREFLFILSSAIALCLIYSALYITNEQLYKMSLQEHENLKVAYADSLNAAIDNLKALSNTYSKNDNYRLEPEYTVVFYTEELLDNFLNGDEPERFAYANWLGKVMVSNDYQQGWYETYVAPFQQPPVSLSMWQSEVFSDSAIEDLMDLKEIQDVTRFQQEQQLINARYITYPIDTKFWLRSAVIAVLSIIFGVRYLFYCARWSVRTLKEY